ncbi:MAG TPA: DUF3987 domain-containing protein [Bacteroidetes bacterium]|nr:DUF3987 domain-containing protein [Bacteroidota bacterium]
MFQSKREKDVFLTSALTVLSGCFPSITGVYDNKKVTSNLFSFIIAPPASGKSALAAARDLVTEIHDEKQQESEAEYSTSNDNSRQPQKVLLIPGNISAAEMIALLNANNGQGVICEPEADTISNCLKQDWGGFSDLLRKAFHNEPISYARKKKHEYIEIKKPRLSLSLSGTPNQVSSLIKSVHDGLYSRFIFYVFRNIPEWKDVSPKDGVPIYDEYIAALQKDIKYIYNISRSKEFNFDLTGIQWTKLNKQYKDYLRESVTFIGSDTSSIVMRLGLIQYRIAMVLSILRYFEKPLQDLNLACSDLDYGIAEIMGEIYLKHSQLLFKIMTKQLDDGLKGNIKNFFNHLPIIPFQRKDAVLIGEKLGIAPRTVSKYLRKLVEGEYLYQDKPQGLYYRIKIK